MRAVGRRYVPELYVERQEAEAAFAGFLESDKSCFVLVDSSGSGKTTLMCHLATDYAESVPAVLLSGRARMTDEHGLMTHVADELRAAGRASTLRSTLEDFVAILRENHRVGIIFVDGLSENEDRVLIKRSLYQLLTTYQDTKELKVCVTCRDTFWSRFAFDFPASMVYRAAGPALGSGDRWNAISLHLGAWSDSELDKAITRYQQFFATDFALGTSARNRCRHPLTLRLLCEAYSGRALGFLEYLPTTRLFRDYIYEKTHIVADYFGLGMHPESLYGALLGLPAALWGKGDTKSLARAEALGALSAAGIARGEEVYARLLDEGILLEFDGGAPTGARVQFLFDGLADHLLFQHFVADLPARPEPTPALVSRLCAQVHAEPINERRKAERFLELIALNAEDPGLQEHLLKQALSADLYVFARCAEQKLAVPTLSEEPEARAREFGERLAGWYDRIVRTYFPRLRHSFDPYSRESAGKALGIDLFASPGFREVSYEYRARDACQDTVQVTFTTGFPTFRTSIAARGKEFQLHDPDRGLMLHIMRDNRGTVRRTLNFERHSPFPGVSLQAPERIAKQDVWEELAGGILVQHWLLEPVSLIQERLVSLVEELRAEGVEVSTGASIEEQRDAILERFARGTRQRFDVDRNLESVQQHLAVLGDKCDPDWLRPPDSGCELTGAEQPNWLDYSDDGRCDYLRALVSEFVGCYRGLVEVNLPQLRHRMNLYRQWPAALFVIVPAGKEYLRLAVAPQNDECAAGISVCVLPADVSDDPASAEIREDGVPLPSRVEDTMSATRRITTTTHPIDVVMPMRRLFRRDALNHLTYNWVKSELAEVLQVPYSWPTDHAD